ncbi:MAG: glycoside hydrolase family 3 protein, partial [Lachnospiraceae bacterium]|nr:glycoside hydrolase family 3 protein [Lachnospiraceae bacterium]
ASLSSVMLTDILRTGMGYNGIIITDSLKMNAVTDNYSPGEAAKLAITAGADLLLKPENFEEAYNALLEAVSSGEITEDRIDDSVRRILSLKSKV